MFEAAKLPAYIYMELSFIEIGYTQNYQGFCGIIDKISNVRQVDKRTAVGYPDRGLVQHGVLCKHGRTCYLVL